MVVSKETKLKKSRWRDDAKGKNAGEAAVSVTPVCLKKRGGESSLSDIAKEAEVDVGERMEVTRGRGVRHF